MSGLVLVGAVIARAGGDGAKTFDRGDEREAALLRVSLLEDEGVDLPTERIEAEAARQWMKRANSSSVVSMATVRRMRARVARIVERGQAHDGRQIGADGRRAHGQTRPMRVMPPFEGGDTGDQWMEQVSPVNGV